MTTSCQLSQNIEETFLLIFPAEQTNQSVNLPALDLCNVTLSLQCSGEYVSSPHEPFNISMLYNSIAGKIGERILRIDTKFATH